MITPADDGTVCTTGGQSGTCQNGTCEAAVTCEANTYVSGSACLSCGSGAISDGTTATCVCNTANGFTGTWTVPATGSDDNGCTQGSTCETNANCKSGYFCAFEDPTTCSDQGTGACELISDYGPDSTTAAGFIRSINDMTYWSAQNWCAAQGKTLATKASIGCSGVYNDYCTSDTVAEFQIWGAKTGWLEGYRDSCHAYSMIFDIAFVNDNFTNASGAYALCVSE